MLRPVSAPSLHAIGGPTSRPTTPSQFSNMPRPKRQGFATTLTGKAGGASLPASPAIMRDDALDPGENVMLLEDTKAARRAASASASSGGPSP